MYIEAMEVGKVQEITCAHVTLCRGKVIYLQGHVQGLVFIGSSQTLNKEGGQRGARVDGCAMSAHSNISPPWKLCPIRWWGQPFMCKDKLIFNT